MHTDENHVTPTYTYIRDFLNAFQANEEMTKKKSSEFLGGKMDFFFKKGHWEIRLGKCHRKDFS